MWKKKITQTQKELHGFANKLTEGSRQSVARNGGDCCRAYWSLELGHPVCNGNWGPWMPVQHLTPLGTATFICQALRKEDTGDFLLVLWFGFPSWMRKHICPTSHSSGLAMVGCSCPEAIRSPELGCLGLHQKHQERKGDNYSWCPP